MFSPVEWAAAVLPGRIATETGILAHEYSKRFPAGGVVQVARDRRITLLLAERAAQREVARLDRCPNCKAAKSAWGRHGCDHSKWGPVAPDLRGLPALYESWTPRGNQIISGIDWGFAESRTVCVTVAIGSDKKAYVNGRRGPAYCEDCRKPVAQTDVRCGPCGRIRYDRRSRWIATRAAEAVMGISYSVQLFKMLGVRTTGSDGRIRRTKGLTADVLAAVSRMGQGRELTRIHRQLLGD